MTTKEDITPGKNSASKLRIFLLKFFITAGLLYAVLIQADIEKIKTYIHTADSYHLILAFLALNAAQLISGLRMRYYFSSAGLRLTPFFSVAIYYVGMLFNLILPGGISGDGYKAWFLQKENNFSWKTSLRLIISERASGLLLLVVFTLLFAFYSPQIRALPGVVILLVLGLVAVFPSYSLLAKTLLKEDITTQLGAVKFSAVIQALSILTAALLLAAVGYNDSMVEYLLLFLISSIVSVIPISIGGVGLRELTFFYGAGWLGLNAELGVTISVLFFVVNALASLLGLAFLYRLKKTDKGDVSWLH